MLITVRRFRLEMDAVIEEVDHYMEDKKGDRESFVRQTTSSLSARNLIPYDKYCVWGGGGATATPISVLEEDLVIKSTLVLIEAAKALNPVRDLCLKAYKANCPNPKKEEWR